jgi:hypothetical protein
MDDSSDLDEGGDSEEASVASEEDEWFDEEVEKQIVSAYKADQRKMTPSLLHTVSWFRVICDEAHMIKDRSTSTAKAVFNLVSLHKWCLTGTPLQNRVGELYSLVRFLRIDPFAYYFCKAKKCDCKSLHYVRPSLDSATSPLPAPLSLSSEVHKGDLRRMRPLGDAALLSFQQARAQPDQEVGLCRRGQEGHAQAEKRGPLSSSLVGFLSLSALHARCLTKSFSAEQRPPAPKTFSSRPGLSHSLSLVETHGLAHTEL